MLSELLVAGPRVYLACGHTDLRKSIDGLAAIVCCTYKLDPFADCLLVFCNRDRIKLKILRWEHNGRYLVIDIEPGEFEMDDDDLTAALTAYNKNPNGARYEMRIGGATSGTIGSAAASAAR